MGPNGVYFFFFSSRRRHTRLQGDWSSDVCSSDLGDAVIATDLQGRVTFMNPVAETLTGWNLQDAIGRDMSDVFNIVNKDTREAIDSGISDVLKNGVGITLPSATVLICRNNLEIPIADGAAPIKDYDGNVTGVVVVFRRDREQTG